jgi:tRNA A37 threonylcarbamoyladenosine synthetase subunit TsaC/SUA5/YrdC
MDMADGSLVTVMTKGIGANLTNDEKRAHLYRLKARTPDRSGMHSRNPAA